MRSPFPAATVEACDFREEMGEDMRERDIARELDGDTWLDDAIEAARAADALRDYEARAKRAAAPIPQPCHNCENVFAGAVCNICKEERPAYTALKAASQNRATRASNDHATAVSGDALASGGTNPRSVA